MAAFEKERVDKPSWQEKPICLIILGMAGSGKTTFVQRLALHISAKEKKMPYVINLDPAVSEVPYPANIDIRDTINYREVMEKYDLGPNGGIVTSLNLFCTKFSKVLELVKNSGTEYAIFDTPGQIEVFTWSISGNIISETLASCFPTIIIYVVDTVKSVSPITFMSNMVYACSILYKTRLPFVVVFSKIDVVDCSQIMEWINDFSAFQEALNSEKSYLANLTRSMSLTLDRFYSDLKCVGVSALEGLNMDEFLEMVRNAVLDFEKMYKVERERVHLEKLKLEDDLGKLSEMKSHGNQVPLITEADDIRQFSELHIKNPVDDSDDDNSDNGECGNEREINEENSFSQLLGKNSMDP